MGRSGDTTASRATRSDDGSRDAEAAGFALAIAWSKAEPDRVGEVALFGDRAGEHLLGRGKALADDPFPRLGFVRQRPQANDARPPLEGERLSRRQLRVRRKEGALELENVGKCRMLEGDKEIRYARLVPGHSVLLEDELLLVCLRRPAVMRPLRAAPAPGFAFGESDPFGLVGEAPVVWELRDRIAFVARVGGHLLVTGASGSGKELVANAVHASSERGRFPLVARNAATLPAGLVDAELFGHAKDYPQAGMPERPGLIGRADGSTLFLDEIAELGDALQSHLLRVLDAGGEYQRLGEPSARRSDFRLIGATNRGEAGLKHDVAARFPLRLDAPGLDARIEDVPLLIRQALRESGSRDPLVAERFLERETGAPRVDPRLVEALLRHRFTHHVRELHGILWLAMTTACDDSVRLTPEVLARLGRGGSEAAEGDAEGRLSAAKVREALELHGGNQERAFRALGLRSRDQLYRLIKKLGLAVPRKRS